VRKVVSFLCCMLLMGHAGAADIKGGKDHPLLGRFVGSEIWGYSFSDYDEYPLSIGPIKEEDGKRKAQVNTIEGKITRILYAAPKGKSPLAVYRNYQKKLKSEGFETLFECKQKGDSGCGSDLLFYSPSFKPELIEYAYQYNRDNRYGAFVKKTGKGDVYVSLMAYRYGWDFYRKRFERAFVQIDVVETGDLDDDQIEVISADDIVSAVGANGRVAIPGIYFDTDKAAIKPESQPALEQIVEAMKRSPELKVHVVGHTDNTGSFKHNLSLSRARAKAVRDYLAGKGVAPDRLRANGVASLAPVSSNSTEEGRAKNRRVELVEQ